MSPPSNEELIESMNNLDAQKRTIKVSVLQLAMIVQALNFVGRATKLEIREMADLLEEIALTKDLPESTVLDISNHKQFKKSLKGKIDART
jgi:hypothetical protein